MSDRKRLRAPNEMVRQLYAAIPPDDPIGVRELLIEEIDAASFHARLQQMITDLPADSAKKMTEAWRHVADVFLELCRGSKKTFVPWCKRSKLG